MDDIGVIKSSELAEIMKSHCEKVLIIDVRAFCEFNTSHIVNAINVWSSKLRKKRLQQNTITVYDVIQQASHVSLQESCFEEVVVYDHGTNSPNTIPLDTFLYVLFTKLASTFQRVSLLQGGFIEFQSLYREMCEDSAQKGYLLTSFSQPCLPVSTSGPTRILPFLFLGSQHDANNKQLLLEHNISYELNVSTSCPKPDFLQDSHFLRIAVNDNFSAKLLPYFGEAFRFIEKVREGGGRVLVHCLAGISRSPTVVISYVMKYFHMHYDEAYRYVKTRRPTISPNINFVGQLLEFDLHLFGKPAIVRCPLRPIRVDENLDILSSPTSASTHSPLLKSSSSSCISSGTPSESGFPFPLNRSLPSLRLNKSAEEVENTSSDLDCFLFEQTYKCSSGKLSSTPVSSPSSPVESPLTPFGSEPEKGSFGCSLIEKNHEGRPCSSVNKENEGHVNKGRVPAPAREISVARSRSCRLCEKVVFNKKGSFDEVEEVVDGSTAALIASKQPLPRDKTANSLIKSTHSSKNPILPVPTPHTQLKRESSAPENSCRLTKEDSLTLPPKTVRSCSSTSTTRKFDQQNYPHLPRSYSSSETYLNTRMRLEKQQAAASGTVTGSNTRKSFSSDEVGRAFQGTGVPHVPPPTPPGTVFHKESYTNPLELVRCDSWSTSGLGSEISDWDSVQGDIQSVEDAQGPFDAVFAEVFPGETSGNTISLRKHQETRKQDDKLEKTEEKICLRKTYSDNQSNGSCGRKCHSTLVPPDQDSAGASPAPRPVSLPGVSGTYNVADSNQSSDMGVELEDHRNWSTEEVDKLGTSWGEATKRLQINFDEHPPVNPKTMGEDVKYFMTWYEIDSSVKEKDQVRSHERSSGEKERTFGNEGKVSIDLNSTISVPELITTCPPTTILSETSRNTAIEPCKTDLSERTSLKFGKSSNDSPEKANSCMLGSENEKTTIDSHRKESLHERWQWWDSEFKKKISNIKKNVCLSPWETNDEGDEESLGGNLTGFHLAQELMQSMEDLLEREISDIKQRASSLSTRFGLHLASESGGKSEELDVFPPPPKTESCRSPTSEVSFEKDSSTTKERNVSAKDSIRISSPGTHVRSRSEPPSCVEECLYRVKSCPGITNCKGMEESGRRSVRIVKDFDLAFRFPRLFRASNKSGHSNSKRYSCSALDFVVNPSMPTFDSCPDVSRARNNGTPESLTPSSSFNRLLKVS